MNIKHILALCVLLCFLGGCADQVQDPTQTQAPTTVTQAPAPELRDSITVEAGDPGFDPGAFLINSGDPVPTILETLTEEQLRVPGTYPVKLDCAGHVYQVSVIVADTTPPTATVQELTCTDGIPDASAFLLGIVDATDVAVRYETEPVLENGLQTVTIILTDSAQNVTKLNSLLTLDLDVEAPQILGVSDILVDQGNAVSYRSGITVTDNRDPSPKLTVDSSQVDLSTPGEYIVTFKAVDAAGNETAVSAVVTVREMKKNYASLETVYEEMDKILDKIIKDDMTVLEQVKAIDNWFWKNCVYTGSSNDTDLHQAAYNMMTKHRGDCYNYFALTTLMLEHLEIPYIEVNKVKNYEGDSNHYWTMVSLDGGETWYHYDTSPRNDPVTGKGVHIFLYTDAELDAFSASYRNCYNRDKSLYPATPEK